MKWIVPALFATAGIAMAGPMERPDYVLAEKNRSPQTAKELGKQGDQVEKKAAKKKATKTQRSDRIRDK